MRLAIACLCLAGCGRIAFDPRSDGGAGGDDDAPVDGGSTACQPFDEVLTMTSSTGAPNPAVAWTGSEYLLVVHQNDAWSLLRIRPDGSQGTTVSNIVPPGVAIGFGTSAMAWSGSVLGIADMNGNIVELRTFDPTNGTIGGPFRIDQTAASDDGVAIAWETNRFVVAWSSGVNMRMREALPTGPIGTEALWSTTSSTADSIAATPTRYVIGTLMGGNPAVVTVDRTLMMAQTLAMDTPGGGVTDVVVRPDGSFAGTTRVISTGKLQLLGTDGTPSGAGVPYPISGGGNQIMLALQSTATGYRLTTFTLATSMHMIERADLDSSGALTGSVTQVGSFDSNATGGPSVIFAGDRTLYVLVYDTITNPYHLRLIQTCE